jgi:hypothetical protein
MLRQRLAESLRGRVGIYQARYRHSREELGRIWIEVDKVEVASFTTDYLTNVRRCLARS